MAHPPPAPPLKLSKKGNVNVVPPMTKTSRPALGVASVIPTSSNPNGNSHDDLSHVTEDTRRMHTFIDTLQHTAEIASPTHEIDVPGVSILSHQPSSNVSSEQRLSNENTMIVTKARTESSKTVAYGPVSETSKQNVLTEQGIIPDKHSEEEIVSKLPENKSDIENNMNIYPLPSGIVKTNEKQCQSQTYRNTPATHKMDETAINTEDKENPTIAPIHVPVATIDNKQSKTGDNTRSSQSVVEINERQLHKTEESQMNHTICERKEIYLTQETIANNGDSVERLTSSQGVHSRTASISSNPAPLMPSVESVVSLDKYYNVNGNADSVVTENKFSESSDSEIEILVSVSNNKNKTHKKNTVKDRGKITEKHDKSIVSNAEPLRQLRSSYRAGPISAGNYNPAVDKKDTKSKIKQSRNDIKQVKQNTDIVDEKDARLGKMSAIYRSRSPRKEIRKTPL
ncbi:uncharacterized protein LOC123552445 [Mercenaria mercenaria]|uniref:uncharacterized protein LOC123552445 n=1 Tax=Mercenaria mercenaria TaxID=6596 RepID=UPI00234E92A8|nr:uncharacterized protein LOC123552445 [Mercenaria mercenaria]XP_053398438.1 uncharacterized protein LOC123552445 [Mercenaria mercenaria]